MIYGIDIGGTKVEIAIFNKQIEMQDSWRILTPVDDYSVFINAIVNLVETADKKFNIQGKIGIGMPGLIDAKGNTLSANLPCTNGQNVTKDLTARLKRKITIENDTRCFTLSEAVDGVGAGYCNVFGAVIGTGAAGGLAINGQLYKTRQRISGDYGHLPLPAFLQQKYQLPFQGCGCGLANCFEGYISGPGMLVLHTHFGGQESSVPEIMTSYRCNDIIAKQTFACYMDLLGSCFSNLVIAYDPDIIVLGGGLSLIDEIVQNLPDAIEQHLFPNFNAPPIHRARYGDASGVRGAAILASRQVE